ncbi:MAG: glycerol-3-phosphate transporter [Bacteroidetes bacterium HGW-Bacteroidetes-11]|jgi:OPA family glycerol-3-phosphate transporter-like MFS transporter|nr:MAG: glycerol-3-phosphate transporter [Bacteroidetes bacterium HGW-Bacteroidetes-11]
MVSFLKPPSPKPLLTDKEVIDKEYAKRRLQVFLGIFIGYAGYYLVRKNISLAAPHLIELGYDKGQIGIAMSGVAIAYGLSKFIMGGISDRSNARYFLPIGLLLSAITTLFMGTGPGLSSLAIVFSLQLLNGWVQGMGWPPSGRIMTHWFSIKERGTKMAFWNVAHNVGGGIIGPLAALGVMLFGAWQLGVFIFPAIIAIVIAFVAFLLIRDTPQSMGLPSIEVYHNDFPKNYTEEFEKELSTKDIFFKYVLNNKVLWYVAFANAFVYMVRYGVLDWAPTYLKEAKGYSITEVGWAYFAYEWAAIPGTIVCGYISDKIFKGRRTETTIIFMALVFIATLVYWKNPPGHMLIDNLSLIAIGFFIYGPVMLIGVHALDLVPKKAAGTAAGLTGLFGYLIGTSLLANIGMGYMVEHYGWDGGFYLLLASSLIAMLLILLTRKAELQIKKVT